MSIDQITGFVRGRNSNLADYIFVSISYKSEMNDVYHYAIRNAANAAGFNCVRADDPKNFGNIDDRVHSLNLDDQVHLLIEGSTIVVAELTEENPNVYEELGYARAIRKPTVRIAKNTVELPFNVRNRKCLIYENISDLEKMLTNELLSLRNKL